VKGEGFVAFIYVFTFDFSL